jgi:multimeric flavodoxin WrbA
MKALVLNGSPKGDGFFDGLLDASRNALQGRGWVVDARDLDDMDISSCRGRFGCWVRTPGVCAIDDEGRDIAKAAVQSRLMVFITPVTFGGYSPALKKAVERLIPILSPFFMKIRGEVHHRPRYDRYPGLIGVGVLPHRDEESENVFRTLIRRNALNLHSPFSGAAVLLRTQSKREIETALSGLFEEEIT